MQKFLLLLISTLATLTAFAGDISLNLTITNSATLDYQNWLTETPVGQFGLINYTLTNSTNNIFSGVQFFPNLKGAFSYDDTRTTCSFSSTQPFYPGQTCQIVIKYQPTAYFEHNSLTFMVVGTSDQNDKVYSPGVTIPYSSCQKGQTVGC